jgi:ectoine hydroxylase-related dioxygenase (phytanoyl-CoA dioxygenase family)
MDDEGCNFHHKRMLKEPRIGDVWEWHQDYGYWYKNNYCLFPDMASCAIAIGPSTRENGCMQLFEGSYRCGRIDHKKTTIQYGADLERGEELKRTLTIIYATMEPGDVLSPHLNTLHRSDANLSENPR